MSERERDACISNGGKRVFGGVSSCQSVLRTRTTLYGTGSEPHHCLNNQQREWESLLSADSAPSLFLVFSTLSPFNSLFSPSSNFGFSMNIKKWDPPNHSLYHYWLIIFQFSLKGTLLLQSLFEGKLYIEIEPRKQQLFGLLNMGLVPILSAYIIHWICSRSHLNLI